MGKVIGIFGGSFAPVHEGHMGVACGVLRRGLVDEVWLLPCRRNPLKDGVALPDGERLRLLENAVAHITENLGYEGRLKVDPIELSMPDPSYTWQTMQTLCKKYPEYEFRLIIGGDSYLNFGKWVRNEWLKENFHPIVFPRPGYEIKDIMDSDFTLLKDVPLYDISSTRLRAQSPTP